MNLGRRAAARILTLTLTLGGGLVSIGMPVGGAVPGGSLPSDEQTSTPEVRTRLERLLESNGSFEQARVEVSCLDDSKFRRVELFGTGVGIWDRSGQFSFSEEQFRRILGFLRQSDFATRPPPPPSSEYSDSEFALKVLCSVSLDIAESTHTEQQLSKEKRKEELYQLADRILDECEGAAANSIRPGSFEEALDLLATGKLAPQTFSLVLHRKPLIGTPGQGKAGLLLQLHGPVLRTQLFQKGVGYSEAIVRRLSHAEIGQLVERFRSIQVNSLPSNLYADEYVDLTFRLLHWEKKVQAQRFAGMTRETRGPRQTQFDQLVKVLSDLTAKQPDESAENGMGASSPN